MPHEKDDEKKGHEPKRDHDHNHHDHEHKHHHHHPDHEHGHHHHHEHPESVPEQHKSRAPRYAKVFLITCSDTRTEATDESGRWLRGELAERGHVLSGCKIVKDEPSLIVAALEQAKAAGAQAVLVNGGTGISSRDSTFEAISAQITRPLPGFGELFRALSHAQIGSAAMLSRAVAGVRADGLIVFAMPGSPGAVRLAAERLIFPELTHLLEELAR
jgi:molybdenum cofactor biosynthesis protein B